MNKFLEWATKAEQGRPADLFRALGDFIERGWLSESDVVQIGERLKSPITEGGFISWLMDMFDLPFVIAGDVVTDVKQLGQRFV